MEAVSDLEQYLENIRVMRETRELGQQLADLAAEERDYSNRVKVLELGRQLLPEAIHPVVSFYGWQDAYHNLRHDHAALLIDLPGCAPICLNVDVSMNNENQVTGVYSAKRRDSFPPFFLGKYIVVCDEEDGEYKALLSFDYPAFGYFEAAVETAMQLGNNKASAQAEADEHNRKAKEPKPVLAEPALYCPLLHMGENTIGQCLRTQCAWWVEPIHACAIKTLAHNTGNFDCE